MPAIPPPPTQAYDTANTVLTMAAVHVNDDVKTLLPVSGKLLDNTIPFTQQAFNVAWRKAQAYLANKGYARLIDEKVIYNFPVVASSDPAIQCWLSFTGCFDGANYYPQPALPTGFDHPLKIWERWSGQNAQFGDAPIEKFLDGLPMTAKTSRNGCWEWRQDRIYIPGSQMSTDFRIRFVSFMPDLIDVGNKPWFQQDVPIVRIAPGLAWLLCAELAISRGAVVAADDCTRRGEQDLAVVFNMDVQADQRVNIRRQPSGGHRNRGYYGF